MKSKKPVELSEKIDYLNQKISRLHWEIKKSDDFQLRLNFQEFIDNSITTLLSIHDKNSNPHSSPPKTAPVAKLYSVEKEQLEMEKKALSFLMNDLQSKQRNIEYDTLQVKLFTKEKQIEEMKKQNFDDKKRILKEMQDLKGRNKFVEKQIEELIGKNKAQKQEIQRQRQERNRAQKNYLDLRDRYQEELGKLQIFGEQKNTKYIDRSSEGLQSKRIFTNVGGKKKILTLKLPLDIQVNKLVYGIKIGSFTNHQQVVYFSNLQLFQKQISHLRLKNGNLVIEFRKRKNNQSMELDEFKIRGGEIVVQLFGKGDSIIVHE